jgi:hypothetical protein
MIKKMKLNGEEIFQTESDSNVMIIPQGTQVKKYQSIEPTRSTMDKSNRKD